MILKLVRTPGIYLVGFMGSGKTTVGRLLADRLGWDFIDLDDEPFGWSTSNIDVPNLWGPPAPESWFKVATPFDGIEPEPPGAAA